MKANSVIIFVATVLLGAAVGILAILGLYVYKNDIFSSNTQKEKQVCDDKADCAKPKTEQPKVAQPQKNEVKQPNKVLAQNQPSSDFEMEYRQLKVRYDKLVDDIEMCQTSLMDVAATNNYLIDKLSKEVNDSTAKLKEAETELASVKQNLDVKIKKLKELESVIKQKDKEIKKLKQKRK